MIYDLIVLGGGPGGYLAAERAGHSGLSVLLIEKNKVGGVCLNEGCIPSKALLNSAKIYDHIKHCGDYGINLDINVCKPSIDQEKVIERKEKIVHTLVSGIKGALKAAKVTVVNGQGVIRGKEDNLFCIDVNAEKYLSKYLLIATGSQPVLPPIKGLKESMDWGTALTNKEVLDLTEIPREMVVIGGGVIGLEMASYYNSTGSNVTVVEMLDHIGGSNDLEISSILQKVYENKGNDFKLGCKVVEIKNNAVVAEMTAGDKSQIEIPADKILVSIGRKPVVESFGLESIGVLVEKGRIKTDNKCMTNIPNVYAAGDVNGISMLAHTAYREAEVAINNIIGKRDIVRYFSIPAVIYTNPEVAGVGETEQSAKEKGIDYKVGKVSMMYSGRFVAENIDMDGICKVLAEKSTGKIIGVHIIGSYASEMIVAAALMLENEMSVDDVKELVFPHPTVSEVIREAIFAV